MGHFRVYSLAECGADGYPYLWHRNVGGALDELIDHELERGSILDYKAGIKHIVRAQARHRCVRCLHPFLVGSSGTFEGNSANAKAFAAEVGVNQETLDAALMEGGAGMATLDAPALDAAPRKLWSVCDSICRHGGPVRFRFKGSEEWGEMSADELKNPIREAGIGDAYEVEALWRILTVHHLNEVKLDLRWWNLVALCQRCHLLIQGKVTMDRPWPWEHTDWFKPYVAAFYAMKYLAEDLDRDDATIRQDELLAIGAENEAVERMPL